MGLLDSHAEQNFQRCVVGVTDSSPKDVLLPRQEVRWPSVLPGNSLRISWASTGIADSPG